MNNGSLLIERQNESGSLELQEAQRQTYRYQKRVLYLLFFLNIVGVLGLAIAASLFQSKSFNEWVAIYGVFLTFFDVTILTPLMKTFGKKAAAIQEQFDCYVFELKQNVVTKPDKVDQYDISRAANKYKKNPGSSLEDWYDDVNAEMIPAEAVLNAQKTNIWWDKKQKEIFKQWSLILMVFIFCIVMLSAFVQDLGFRSLLAYILPLILPSIIFLHQFYTGLLADIDQLKRLESIVNTYDASAYDEYTARQVQDAIYEHRRTNTPVFDWFYEKYRDAFKKGSK